MRSKKTFVYCEGSAHRLDEALNNAVQQVTVGKAGIIELRTSYDGPAVGVVAHTEIAYFGIYYAFNSQTLVPFSFA